MNSTMSRDLVRRSLFGPVDHEQLRRDLKQRLKEITEQDARRWNFNFHSESPLPGRFQWEEIPAGGAAAFYSRVTERLRGEEVEDGRGGGDAVKCAAGSDQENCPSIFNAKRPAEVMPVRRKRSISKPTARPGNNTQITDFFAKRRRSSSTETKSVLTPLLHASESAQCKTIR